MPEGQESSGGYGDSEVEELRRQILERERRIAGLTAQLANERLVNQRLLSLNEITRHQDASLHPDHVPQETARLLANLIRCDLVCIFEFTADEQRFKLLSSAGPFASLVPAGYRPETSHRVISQAVRSQRLVSLRDLPDREPPLLLGERRFYSLLAQPIVSNGTLRGLILLADSAEGMFTGSEPPVLETAARRLITAWNYNRQNAVLIDFVQAISMMPVVQEPGSLLEVTASIARQTLGADFVIVASFNQQEWLMRWAGRAPHLIKSLNNGAASFLEAAVQSPYTFRLSDLRDDERARCMKIDTPNLRTLLACPMRINGSPTGILLAFGKHGAETFTDTDVFLAELLTTQTTANLESCYLNTELRASLKTTQLLYDLSLSITKAETLKDASTAIARTAYRLLQARKCGLILFAADGKTEAEVHFPTDDPAIEHPFSLIQQAMDSRQTIYLSESDAHTRVAIPIQTMRRCYGALWLDVSDGIEASRHPTEEIRILVNQAAVALERSILLEETRQQTMEIAQSYTRLEGAYEDMLYGLTKALDARDGETEKHSWRVEDLSVRLGMEMGLSRNELQALKRGALLHDIGKIGVRDAILLKRGPLDEGEWLEMRQHPQKGAQIIQDIPALHDALPVIAFHQERWDGSGYPLGLCGQEIPLLARLFAVVDVFDALTSDRPYRRALSVSDTLAYLEGHAGIHFDPEVVEHFTAMIRSETGGTQAQSSL
jgi:HD-GYP domain-containing protein (c-di-GMP phosphodiesterase class II)